MVVRDPRVLEPGASRSDVQIDACRPTRRRRRRPRRVCLLNQLPAALFPSSFACVYVWRTGCARVCVCVCACICVRALFTRSLGVARSHVRLSVRLSIWSGSAQFAANVGLLLRILSDAYLSYRLYASASRRCTTCAESRLQRLARDLI